MHTFKKLGLWLFVTSLQLSLFGFAVFMALNAVIGNPATIKDTLNESGLYEISIKDMLVDSAQDQAGVVDGSLDIDDPIVSNAIDDALPEQTVQSTTEQIVDGVFAWLQGDAPYPDFKIDFTEEKNTFIAAVADGAVERIEKLPPCSVQQLQSLGEIDPLTINCRPPVNLTEQRNKIVSDLQNDAEFLSMPVISGEELLKEAERHDSAGLIDRLPAAAQIASMLPLILLLAALVSTVLVLLLAETKRKGLKKVSVVLLTTGAFLSIVQLVFIYLASRAAAPPNFASSPDIQEPLIELVQTLQWKTAKPTLLIAAIYVAIGVAILLYLRFRKPSVAATTTPLKIEESQIHSVEQEQTNEPGQSPPAEENPQGQ